MKIHKQGGQVIYEGEVRICISPSNLNITLTENLSSSDKRRKLLEVQLTPSEIKQCVDKLGYKIMPQWLVAVFEFAEKVGVKLKGLVV